MSTATRAPKQTALEPRPEEAGMSLVRPMVWLSRIFPGTHVAVSVSEVQVMCRSKHGPPSVEECQRFLLFCAGWGVDPRIGQAYMIPFEEEAASGTKYVVWQKGLNYQTFQYFANQTGIILGAQITPDPEEWPVAYPGDDFHARITIARRAPLLPVTYGCRVGSVAQKRNGKLARAWADGKVGWAHMFQVALERRGFRRAMAIGPAYGAEEFGEKEPEMPEGYEEAVIVPDLAEVETGIASEMQSAADVAVEDSAVVQDTNEAPPEGAEWQGEAQSEQQPEPEPPTVKAADLEGLTDEDLRLMLVQELKRVCGDDRDAPLRYLRHHHGSQVRTMRDVSRGSRIQSILELSQMQDGKLRGWVP